MAIEIVDIFPLKMVIFHSYVNVYQRVRLHSGVIKRDLLEHPNTKEMEALFFSLGKSTLRSGMVQQQIPRLMTPLIPWETIKKPMLTTIETIK